MAAVSPLQRAMVRRPRCSHPDPDQQQRIFFALQVPQKPLRRRWILELGLFLTKLPPAQPPLPSLLPRFSPFPRTQAARLHIQSPSEVRSLPHPASSSAEDQSDTRIDAHILRSDPRFERREQRQKDLKRLLGPLQSGDSNTDSAGYVLLCWGPSPCQVLAVKHMERDMDHELFWKRLRAAWYVQRGRWRSRMPWYGIKDVRMVEIRLVGPDPDTEGLFLGVYKRLEDVIETEKQKLREEMSTYCDPIPDETESCYPSVCTYDCLTGSTTHSFDRCPEIAYYLESPEEEYVPPCPVSKYRDNKNRLAQLEMEPLRTLLFQNPKIAVYNEVCNTDLVYCSKDVFGQYEWEYFPSMGQLVFRGLHIEDGWTFDSTMVIMFMPLAAVVSIMIVFFARLIYGDWGVAWNVGACFIPLLTGVGSWLHHTSASRP